MNPAGQLDILNVGAGHIEIKFDANDPIEATRAKRIIIDMLTRGYALFIEGKDRTLCRVHRFIAESGTYIIADGPGVPDEAEEITPATLAPAPVPQAVTEGAMENPPPTEDIPPRPRDLRSSEGRAWKKKYAGMKGVSMSKAKVTAVGRSAGG